MTANRGWRKVTGKAREPQKKMFRSVKSCDNNGKGGNAGYDNFVMK
jgi:hypothetical protein